MNNFAKFGRCSYQHTRLKLSKMIARR